MGANMKEQDNTIEKLMTIEKLINELVEMRHQIIELKDSETQRRMAVEALHISENKYRTLLENIPHKLFVKNINSDYLSCNDHYARDLKIKPNEIVGKTDFDFFPREIAEKNLSDDKRIMDSGRGEEIEERYTPAGEGAFIRMVKTPIKDEKGNVTGILGVFWDITGQKQAEEELKKNLQVLEEEVTKGKIELQINNEQIQKETAERKRLEEELRGSEVKWRTAETKITERMVEFRTIQEQLHAVEEKCRTLETKITERTTELQAVQQQLQMETNVRQRTEEQLHTVEEKRRVVETKVTELTSELQMFQEELQKETTERRRTEEQFHNAEEKGRVVETKATELTSELQMFQEELQKETTERQRMEEHVWGMEEKVRVVEAQGAKRTVEVEKVREEVYKEVVDHRLAQEALQKNEEAKNKLVKENAIR